MPMSHHAMASLLQVLSGQRPNTNTKKPQLVYVLFYGYVSIFTT